MKRAVFDVILFISLFVFPWWITALLAFVGMFVFSHFFEFIAVSVIYYAIYSIEGNVIISSPVWFPIIICLTFFIIQVLRQHIILYKNEISY